jgi:putative ABC transport system permease protein
LGVACVNYANLSTAQALVRVRELGLRRVLGASGMQIATQQWIESGMQLAIALLLSAPLAILGVVMFGEDAASTIGRVAATSGFWIGILATSVGVVFMLGAYTAFVILRAHPVHALRGSKTNSGTGSVSRLLVGVQFATASILIIGLVIVHEQNDAVREHALRGDSDPVVVLEFPGRDAGVKFDTLKETLLQSSTIREVSGIIRTPWSTRQPSITGVSTEPGATLRNALVDFVRYDFERALGTPMLAGRSFDPKFNDITWPASDTTIAGTYPIVIGRATAKQLGWPNPSDAVNKTIYWPLWSKGNLSGDYARMQIIGVAEDNPLRFDAGPGAHLQIYALVPNVASNFIVRINKNRISEALAVIDATWKTFVPYAPVRRHFMDEMFEREYRTLERTSNALSIVTLVGTSIATMGLFGMATFIATRRRHEIGVRKTLGASVRQIIAMLLRDLSKPVLIANLLVWPIAFIAVQKYLNLFIQRVDLTALPFVFSLLLTLLIAWIAVGGQAWRAARINPANVLRHE